MRPGSGDCGRFVNARNRVAHLTTVDMSLRWLLATELLVDLEAGFEVFGISAPGPHVTAIEALGVQHVGVPELTRTWDPMGDLGALRRLLSILVKLDLDILHTHNPKTGVMGRAVGRLLRIPVIVNTCHGVWYKPGDGSARKSLVYGMEALAAQCSDAELYQNDVDRQWLRHVVPRTKGRTVGNGIDLDRFIYNADGRKRVRQELGVSDDQLLVGGVGRAVVEKGVLEFVQAAGLLRDRARFAWVGPADDDKSDAVSVPGGDVSFLGLRHDMPSLYSAFDVFALPSYREGFSRAAMEAAACGRAMVLTDIRGCREVGSHGEHLLLVPPRDPRLLAGAIMRLLEQPNLRERLGGAARERAREAFDQRLVARASLEAYKAVALRKRLDWGERPVERLGVGPVP